jgi:hypothetical protein
MVDRVVARADLPVVLGQILSMLMGGKRRAALSLRPAPLPMDPISERLRARHPQRIDLSLERMRVLCAALGDPQDRLPPVVHVAGTNGKGSTVAFIRAIAEAAGLRCQCIHLAPSGAVQRAHPAGRAG